MKRKKLLLLLALAIVGTAFYLFKPKPLSDREAITLLFQRVVDGVRTRDASLLLSLVSPDYQDSFGVTYFDIKRNLRHELNRATVLDLTIENIQPAITPPDAWVKIQCTLLIQMDDMDQPFLFPLFADVYLKKQGKEWKVIRVEGYGSVVGKIYGEGF